MSIQSDTSVNSVAQSPLFRLPPELRNRIYEYAVYRSAEHGFCVVTATSGIPEPALLLTCKLIRQEAIGIFYAENKFMADTPSFDSRAYLLIRRKIISLLEGYGCGIPMGVVYCCSRTSLLVEYALLAQMVPRRNLPTARDRRNVCT